MIELNGASDRDLLVQLLTNQSNITEKIDSFTQSVNDLHSRIDNLDAKVDKKFDGIMFNCRNQRNDCEECIDGKLPSSVFYWTLGVIAPLLCTAIGIGFTMIHTNSEKLAVLISIVEKIAKTHGM